jgi:hypothetical protein
VGRWCEYEAKTQGKTGEFATPATSAWSGPRQ